MKHPHTLCLIGLILITNIFAIEKLYISGIKFTGNSFIQDYELRSIIKLQPPRLFFRSEFSLKKLNRDKISLESYYKSNGFLNIEITEKYEKISKNHIDVHFYINEGIQFKLKEISFFGNKLFTNDDLIDILNLSPNENFNPAKIRKQLRALKRKYLTKGKINISIMDEINIENNNAIARINIFEGTSYFINNIYVSGLSSVKEKYVLREILFETEELYNIDNIDESKRRIFDSGLFSSVEIINKSVDNENGVIDIEIKVREYKSSSIEANFSFTEIDAWQENLKPTGVETQARWVLGNIFNTTSNIEFTGRISSDINLNIFTDKPLIKKDFTAIYRTPWTLHFRIPAEIKYFHNEQSKESDLTIDGLTYSLKFDKLNGTRYEFNSTFEIIQSNDSLYTDTEDLKEPARWMDFIYLSNKIKNPLNPTGGQYLSFISTLYGTFLGGERHLIKFEGEFRKYVKIGIDNIIALRVVAGYINNLETDNDLPEVYRFQLGGQTSLRGWASPDKFEVPSGSLISDMINLEYRFPIWKKIGGELFIDAGRLYETIDAITNTSISWDYGVGATYQTALGPIRIDIGFPYGELSKSQLHASLLYMF
jgi:outer membrane protein insertion porin family